MTTKWTTDDIPDQRGRIAIVTGANSGIGLVAARELARAGARVVLACRDTEKGAAAARDVATRATNAEVEVSALDLASLESVRAFAERFRAGHEGLDLLINNAGVMAPPRRTTADGFELQFGTNHLGHFALTGLLLETMQGRNGARVVNVSSGAHRFGQSTSRIFRANESTAAGARTGSRSLRISSSPSSLTGACAPPDQPSVALPRIPVTPRLTCSLRRRRG